MLHFLGILLDSSMSCAYVLAIAACCCLGIQVAACVHVGAQVFAKCGVIKEDDERRPRVKVYRDRESGMPKGDGLVTYLKDPSVRTLPKPPPPPPRPLPAPPAPLHAVK